MHVYPRNLLHLQQLEAFERWAVTQGYRRESCKAVFEVGRLRRAGQPPCIYYQHNDGDHASMNSQQAYRLVRQWLASKRQSVSRVPQVAVQ